MHANAARGTSQPQAWRPDQDQPPASSDGRDALPGWARVAGSLRTAVAQSSGTAPIRCCIVSPRYHYLMTECTRTASTSGSSRQSSVTVILSSRLHLTLPYPFQHLPPIRPALTPQLNQCHARDGYFCRWQVSQDFVLSHHRRGWLSCVAVGDANVWPEDFCRAGRRLPS